MSDRSTSTGAGRRLYSQMAIRPPQPEDIGRPSLISLGTDILTLVLNSIYHSHAQSLQQVARVSSYFHHLARYAQHQELTLTIPRPPEPKGGGLFGGITAISQLGSPHGKQEPGPEEEVQDVNNKLDYLELQALLPAVRCLKFERLHFLGKRPELLERICALVPRMPGLQDLTWPHDVTPPTLLRALDACEKTVRLHTRFRNQDATAASKENNLHALQGNTNLYSLTVAAKYRSDAARATDITHPLKQVLLTCPNLRRLSLDLGLPTSGCVIEFPPAEYVGCGFRNGERPLAALETLEVRGYPFGRVPTNMSSRGVPNQAGYPEQIDEQTYWLEHFDWSQMRHLEVQDPHLALKLMPKLTVLKEVLLGHRDGDNATKLFHLEVPTQLEGITVAKLRDVGIEAIARHGGSLKRLHIHQNEDYQGNWRTETPTASELCDVRKSCPLLEEIALDVARKDGNWPFQVFDELARFPRLRSLEMWFELGLDDRESPQKPHLTVASAAMLWQRLHTSCSAHKKSKLERLVLHSGSPPPLGHGYPAPAAFWPSSQRVDFTIELSPRDDDAARGRFELECLGIKVNDRDIEPKLAEARKRLKTADLSGMWAKEERKWATAVDGPVPVSEWKGGYGG